jgi:hypothetical protein
MAGSSWRKEPDVADEPCIHCHEQHPPTTAFCPNTGKPMQAAAVAARPAGPPPPPADAGVSSNRRAAPPPPPRASAGVPSWVTSPEGPPEGEVVGDNVEKGVFDLLKQAFELYKKNAKILITVAAIVFVPGALVHACAHAAILGPTVAVTVALDPNTHLPAPVAMGTVVAGMSAMLLGLLAAAITGLLLYGVIVPLTQGALALAAADRVSGGAATWRDVWSWLLKRLGVLLSAVIPAALLTAVGFFFLVLPGLILSFFFSFVPLVALFEGLGGTAALKRSYALVRSDWLRMLLVLIAFGVVTAVARLVAGMMPLGLFGTRLLQDALTLVAMPVPVVGAVLLYFDIRRTHDPGGFDERRLADELATLRSS